jgi:hypothetical protein
MIGYSRKSTINLNAILMIVRTCGGWSTVDRLANRTHAIVILDDVEYDEEH